MSNLHTIPVIGLLLAFVTFLAMLLVGVDALLALGILIVWAGSLFLATQEPPDTPPAETDPRFTRDTMRDLMENSAIPLLLTEGERITVANKAALRILGKHVIGQDARMAFRQPEAVALFSKGRSGTAIVKGLARRRDIWRLSRQRFGKNLAVIELINQTAEADISRAHTDFVANASHELRTPLAAIIGYVETLSEEGTDLDEATSRKFLDTIQREAKRLQNLVSDLMSLSRVEAEKHELPAARVELGPVVERAARDAATGPRVRRLEFALTDAPAVRGDVQQLEQLVRNLVDNAFKYGGETGPVTVSVSRGTQGSAVIEVQDRGEGIAAEHLPHLTRRFYRTDPGRSRASGGTGLGLAIVKHIVERHRGRLDIESEVGEGTRIVVRIPPAGEGDEASS